MVYRVRWWVDDFSLHRWWDDKATAFEHAQIMSTLGSWRVEVHRVTLESNLTKLQLLNEDNIVKAYEVVSEQEWKTWT